MAATGACEIPGFVRAGRAARVRRRRPPARTARAPQRRARHRVPRLSRRVVPARPPAAVARPVRPRRGRLRPLPGRLADPPPLRVAGAARASSPRSSVSTTIYPYADPLGALNLAVMTDGDQLQWHFDQTDFVVSLAIQDADVGGDFEVAPQIRTADDEHYDDVAARARRRHRRGRDVADDARHAARVRGALLDPPGEPDRRRRRPASSRCSATTPSRARCRASC